MNRCDEPLLQSTQRLKQFVEIEEEPEFKFSMRTRPSVVEENNKMAESNPVKILEDKPNVSENEEEDEKLEYKPEIPPNTVKRDSKRETEQKKRSKFEFFTRKKPSYDSLSSSEKSESLSARKPILKKLKTLTLTRRKSSLQTSEDQQADENKSKHYDTKTIKHKFDDKNNDVLEMKGEAAKLSESKQSLHLQLSKLSSRIRSHFSFARRSSSQQSNDDFEKSTRPSEKANEEKWCDDEDCRKQDDLSSKSQQENKQQMAMFDDFEDQDQFGSPEDLLSQSSSLSCEREENDDEENTTEEEISGEAKAKLGTAKSVLVKNRNTT